MLTLNYETSSIKLKKVNDINLKNFKFGIKIFSILD